MKVVKKIQVILLSVSIILSSFAIVPDQMALAESNGEETGALLASGTCGPNATWELDKNWTMTISGSGEITRSWEITRSSGETEGVFDRTKKVIINNGITSIGDMAFGMLLFGLTNITIPESVTSIGRSAFLNCKSLTSITIPDSVTNIGNSAFSGCSGLASITISDSVTSIGDDAFSGCSGLTSITIPDGVTSIGNSAFSGCSGLTSITISDGVTNIGDSAFSGCSGLTSVTIPESVTSIGGSAFSWCSDLVSITIPDSVTSIGDDAFSGCSGLTSITIPDGVTSIDAGAFGGCSGLTSITIPENVTNIGNGAFGGCSGLTSITIPDGVTSIGEKAFLHCDSLTSITVPESVTSIGYRAFTDCGCLINIYVDEANMYFKSIDGVLHNKAGDALIEFPGGRTGEYEIRSHVRRIGDRAFSSGKLTKVTVPDGITTIGDSAFAGKFLVEVVFAGSPPETMSGYAFYNIDDDYEDTTKLVYYPETDEWAAFGKDYQMTSWRSYVPEPDQPDEPVIDPAKPAIYIGGANTKAGEELTVQVSIINNPGIAGLQLTPVYDKAALTLKSIDAGELGFNVQYGKNIIIDAAGDIADDGCLITMTFAVNEETEAGDYDISLTVRECTNEAWDEITLQVAPGVIHVYDFLWGDANDDDTISIRDVVLIRKYLADYDYDTESSSVEVGPGADANGDGNVSIRDVVLLRKYLADFDYETGESGIVLGP